MKILIIEDYQGDVDLLRSRLKTIGCEVVVAMTAEDGFALAVSEQPDMILTDLNLGEGIDDGIKMLAALRADDRTAVIPTVLHSVFVSHVQDMPTVQSQADGFLPKPFRFVELSKLVARFRQAQEGGSR
ncbi:MAG: response regulator [Candidatus Sericytochromatia bacterium]